MWLNIYAYICFKYRQTDMETKELIFENLINVASEFNLDDALSDDSFLGDNIAIGFYFCGSLSTNLGTDSLTNELLEKFYFINKDKDFKSKEVLKKEVKGRIYNNIDPTQIKNYILNIISERIERFKKDEYNNFRQINIVLGLLKEAKILFEDGRHIDVERCLATFLSYTELLEGGMSRHATYMESAIALNRLFFPLSYYKNIC